MSGEQKYNAAELMAYATPSQKEKLQAVIDCNGNRREAARRLGINWRTIASVLVACHKKQKEAALRGEAPEYNLNHPTAPGYETKRVSTLYNQDGDTVLQWHIQAPEQKSLEDIAEGLREAFSDIKPAKPIKKPARVDEDLACCLLIGDHHHGMYAWGEETGEEDYDTSESKRRLITACKKLIARSPSAQVGYLINLGDFLHANDSTSSTPSSKNLLDTDGRMGRVGRQAGTMMKTCIDLMLQKHEKVVVINARGNHDPDASLWLNEICRAYYINEPRVEIMDNFNKFVWFTFGNNLVVTHHGDKMTWTRMYEAVTRNLSEQWGKCKHRFGWTGHLHHDEGKEIGGMRFKRWGVLAPNDAWHAGMGFGSERNMSCVVLHKKYGHDTLIEVGIDEIDDEDER